MANNNEVRIIGGQWKGRRLRFPDRPGLRPTLGRVRETLFNWLVSEVRGARCLDLFAGSGALGLEALSRGAAEVTFVEKDRKAAAALSQNLRTLGSDAERHAEVRVEPAERYLERSLARAERFDIVFFDPPFDHNGILGLVDTLREQLLEPGGLIYLERDRHSPWPNAELLVREGEAGDCRFGLLDAKPAAKAAGSSAQG